MVSCREFLELMLDGWLARELPLRRHHMAATHVAHCRDCANYVDSYETTERLLRQLRASESATAIEMPEDLLQTILLRQAG